MRAAKARFDNDVFCADPAEVDNVFTTEIITKNQELCAELIQKAVFANDVISLTDLEFTRGTEAEMEIIDPVPKPVPASPEKSAKIKTMVLSRPSLRKKVVSYFPERLYWSG